MRTHTDRRQMPAPAGTPRRLARQLLALLLATLLLSQIAAAATASVESPAATPAATPPVRVAVVGGLVLCGVWPALAALAEQATGLSIETVGAAPKEGVVPLFRAGEADLLIIHGSDEAYALLAAGDAAPLRAWAFNEHVIVGPLADPAGVRGAADGAEAIRRIVAADAPLMGFRDPGSFSITHALFRTAGRKPGPRQQLFDDGERPQDVLVAAARHGAYAVVGHIPVAFGKMPSTGTRVLLAGDPAMRRVYVVVEPGPRHPADTARRERAQHLADYLLGSAGQRDLLAADRAAGGPWIFPLPAATLPGHAQVSP